MKKIPTMFERDWDGDRSRVLPVVAAGCEWVLEGEGIATRKYDGTAVLFDGNAWYVRRQVKEGKQAPPVFLPVETDSETGTVYGWEPVGGSPVDRWWSEAIRQNPDWEVMPDWEPGTYELVGPKVQGNPEGFATHQLILHAGAERYIVPRTFGGMRELLSKLDVEGFVFQHPDGRMAKIKKRDFGLRRDA